MREIFTYLHDRGDEWRHKVPIEKKVLLDEPLIIARCMAGGNTCPPEAIGGAPGYKEFLEVTHDPHHTEHKELTKCIGGKFGRNGLQHCRCQRTVESLPKINVRGVLIELLRFLGRATVLKKCNLEQRTMICKS